MYLFWKGQDMGKIYTRTGDAGETGMLSGERASKAHARFHAVGTVDELNAVLGVALAVGVEESVAEALRRVQRELFTLGADLATPADTEAAWVQRITDAQVTRLEVDIDAWEAELPPLKQFILPGGGVVGALLHQARTVCRRAERWAVALHAEDPLNPIALRYLNRLSDWLFVLARRVNMRSGHEELPWGTASDA